MCGVEGDCADQSFRAGITSTGVVGLGRGEGGRVWAVMLRMLRIRWRVTVNCFITLLLPLSEESFRVYYFNHA